MNKQQRSVSFGDVEVFQFSRILGDNPAVSEGAPMSIGWEPFYALRLRIDIYEEIRESQGKRSPADLLIPRAQRELHLISIGYTFNEVLEASDEAQKIRTERVASLQYTKWDKFNDVVDKTRYKLKKFVQTNPKNRTPKKSKALEYQAYTSTRQPGQLRQA